MEIRKFSILGALFVISVSAVCFAAETMVNQEKAHDLAYTFFKKKQGAISGSVANGIERKKYWEFQPYYGVAAKPTVRKIRVNKKDGKVHFSHSFTNILKFLFP